MSSRRKDGTVVDNATAFARTMECPAKIACDGTNMVSPARIAKGMCGKCEEKLAKRAKGPAPLKGAKLP